MKNRIKSRAGPGCFKPNKDQIVSVVPKPGKGPEKY